MMAHEFKSSIVQTDRLLPGIHGLRGLAALAVAVYHSQHLGGIMPPDLFEFIGRDFKYSVHLFFILSAFSLYYSTEPRIEHHNWLVDYFLKRFFRIAPLFYSIIAFEIGRQIVLAGRVMTDFNTILLNVTFTFGFVPFSSFIWGGWSVGVEMIFYVILPVLLLTIRTHRSALVLLVISIVTCYFIRSALHAQHNASIPQARWDWSYFAFASNMSFFAMGIYAYQVSRLYKGSILAARMNSLFAVIIIGGLMFFDAGKHFHGDGGGDLVIWGLGLMALCTWQSISPSLILANRIFQYFGERSFSIYLLHPIIIVLSKDHLLNTYGALQPYLGAKAFFICATLIIALVLVFGEFTYRLIEVPGIRFGRSLATQWRLA
jgi:peptidoglycan/LPS O-acetylase OafA/YrhL